MAPGIREYTDPLGKGGLQPSELGVNSQKELGTKLKEGGADVGREIGGAVSAIGTFVARGEAQKKAADEAAAQAEISTGTAAFGAWSLNASDKWDETFTQSDPNDTSVGSTYLQDMQVDAETFVNGFHTVKGQQWAREKVDSFILTQAKSARADMSRRAGDTAIANVQTYTNTHAGRAESNPDQLDSILDAVPADLAHAFPAGVGGAVVDKARAEAVNDAQKAIAQKGLNGMAQHNPDQFLKDFQDGKFAKYGKYGVDLQQSIQVAKGQVVFNRDAANAKTSADAKAIKAKSDKAMSSIMGSTIGADGKQTVTDNQLKAAKDAISQFPDQANEWKDFYNYLNKEAHPTGKEVNDAATQADFTKRMNTDLTAQDVYNAVANGKLSPGQGSLKNPGSSVYLDAIKLRAEKGDPLANAADKDSFNRGLHLFDVPFNALPSSDPNVTQQGFDRQNDYQTWYANTFAAWQRQGISVHDMLTPGSPSYLPNAYLAAHPEYAKANPNGVVKLPSTPVPNAPVTFGRGGVQTQQAPPAPPPGSPAAKNPAPVNKLPPLNDDIFNKAGVQKTSYVVPQNIQSDIYAAVGSVQSVFGGAVDDYMPSGNSLVSVSASGETDPIKLASLMIGQDETSNRGTIAAFIKRTAGINIDPKQTAWCAAWVNAVLAGSGYSQSQGNRLSAYSFENYGTNVMAAPAEGDVVVFRWRDGGGHVGFYMGEQVVNGKKYVAVLGGNQGGAKMGGGGVSISLQPADQISAIRRIPRAGTIGA